MDKNPKKRMVNFRSFLVIACMMIAAIFLALLYYRSFFWGVLLSVIFLIISVFGVFILLRLKIEPHKIVTLILGLLLMVTAMIVIFVTERTWIPDYFIENHTYSVRGTVDFNGKPDGERYIILDQLSLDGRQVKGKMRVYIREADPEQTHLEFAREGDRLSFQSVLRSAPLLSGGRVNSAAYKYNTRYYTKTVSDSAVRIEIGKPGLLKTLRAKIYQALGKGLNDEHRDIAYSMITGDKNQLPGDVAGDFSASGLGHIMAVSGLHVGFVVMALMLLFKKLRIRKAAAFLIIGLALLFYCFLADFSVSVIRAVIMSLIGLFTMVSGGRRDILNNLCCAVCVLLVIGPFHLFDAGFLMSVCAVLGIILFGPPIQKALAKIRLPKRLAKMIATPTAVQIGILPVMIYYFKSFAIYSIVINILMMPVIMVTFIGIFVSVLLTIFSPAQIFIQFFGFGLWMIDRAAGWAAGLPYATVIVFSGTPIFLCYLFFWIGSRFVMQERLKRTVSVGCLLLCVCLVAAGNAPYHFQTSLAPVASGYYEVTSILADKGKTYVIGDLQNAADVKKTLISMKINKVSAVFLSHMNEKTARETVRLHTFYKGFTVYFPMQQSTDGLDILTENSIDIQPFYYDIQHTGGSNIYPVYDKLNAFLCYQLRTEAHSVLFFGMQARMNFVPDGLIEGSDCIRAYAAVAVGKIHLVHDNQNDSFDERILSASKGDGFVYNYQNGKVKPLKMQA